MAPLFSRSLSRSLCFTVLGASCLSTVVYHADTKSNFLCEAAPTQSSSNQEDAETCPLDDPLGQIQYQQFEYSPASETTLPCPGIQGYSCASYTANKPIEDRFKYHLDDITASYVSVFDGHGGWQAAEYAQQHLVENTRKEIHSIKSIEYNETMISKGITRAFERTDRDFLSHVRPSFETGFGSVARVGACALLTFISGENQLFVANAGDVRAVLGQIHSNSDDASKPQTLTSLAMSDDHNAKIPREKARLTAEHPGESDIIRCKSPESCYVKGRLQPTRSLGDFYLKYSEFNGPKYQNGDRSRGRHIPAPYTPPYISATPEIKTHQLTSRDRFLIIGSDGVWDFLDNQEAVEIVQREVDLGMSERASKALIEAVLQKSAMNAGLTLKQLLSLPPGGHRRRLHDDTTAVVLFFDHDNDTPPQEQQSK